MPAHKKKNKDKFVELKSWVKQEQKKKVKVYAKKQKIKESAIIRNLIDTLQ